MAAVKRDIYCDFTSGLLVQSTRNNTPALFPSPFHQDNIRLTVHPLEFAPTNNPTQGPFAEIDTTGMSLTVKLLKSDGTVLASQSSWTVEDETTLVGNLDCNTANMATEFPALPSAITSLTGCIIEFEFSDADGKVTVQQGGITIKREYIIAGSPSALPLPSYYTQAEINALFVRFSGNPAGASITLVSPDGNNEAVLRVDDEGEFQTDAV